MPVFLILLLLSFAHNYIAAMLIENAKGKQTRKALLAVNVAMNLAPLLFFKYYGFIADNMNALASFSGVPWLGLPPFAVQLPIGISFYTFQVMSYVIDVYRRETPAQRSAVKLLMYEIMFCQLVAGPIIRYKDIARDIENRDLSVERFSKGVSRFIAGLGKKVFFADICGSLSDQFLGRDPGVLSVAGAWIGIALFALQIYFDFSGYTDMAIGMGHMFGFTYKENFNYPYMSKSATEFWRRWHMSLGSFFRDYLYIPLGGNRRFYLRNLAIVWFLTGLWHGASWNFVLWGVYYAVLIAIEKVALARFLGALPKAVGGAIGHAYLLFATLIGWAVFYYNDLGALAAFVGTLFGRNGVGAFDVDIRPFMLDNAAFIAFAAIAATPFFKEARVRLRSAIQRVRTLDALYFYVFTPLFNIGVLLLATILLAGDTHNPFLYFQF